MMSKSIAGVCQQLEQISEELLATFTGRDRFPNENEFISAARALERRLRRCISDLKELDKQQPPAE